MKRTGRGYLEVAPVPATCPTIDRAQALIRAMTIEPSREARAGLQTEACNLLEQLRTENEQLRHNAASWELEARGARAYVEGRGLPTSYPKITKVRR